MFFAGNKVEKLCDLCNITVNKNAVFGDSSALAPGGVRVGKKLCMDLTLFSESKLGMH
jgi:glycine/serine hydroxymethyltransferase